MTSASGSRVTQSRQIVSHFQGRGPLVALVVLTGLAREAQAAEQRCSELGAACVCSEPFNTNNLVQQFGSYWYNPADTTVKECSTLGVTNPGQAVEANPLSNVIARNDAVALGAFPLGHTINYFLAGINGHENIFFAGHKGFASNEFTKRVAARWYVYHSPDFEFSGDGSCSNHKFGQFGGLIFTAESIDTNPNVYPFTGWSGVVDQDCCWVGPISQSPGMTKAKWRGAWWRIEVVIVNRQGPGFDLKMYIKDVTNNGPELLAVDTSQSCDWCGPSGWVASPNLDPPPNEIDGLLTNNYRQAPCNGWRGISSYMVASWDTNLGQRIGPAYEIEGGGGPPDTTPPSIPTGLTATAVSSSRIDLRWSPSTDDVGVSGYRIFRGGGLVATVTTTAYSDTSLAPATTYTYTVSAFDVAGNESTPSAPLSVTTLSASVVGDLNGDGRLSLADVRLLIQMLIGQVPPDLATADLNSDGQLSLADVRGLVNMMVSQ